MSIYCENYTIRHVVYSGKIGYLLELQRNRKWWNARGIDDFNYYVQLILFHSSTNF